MSPHLRFTPIPTPQAVDDTNRAALVAMGAPHLLAAKFTRCAAAADAAGAGADAQDGPPLKGGAGAALGPASQAVGAAALRALVALLRSDALKLEFWAGVGGAALLALLRGPLGARVGDLAAAAFAAAEALAFGAGTGATRRSSGSAAPAHLGGGIFCSGFSGAGSGSFCALSGGVSGAGCQGGAPQLLEPRLLEALAASCALHPCSGAAAATPALRLLLLGRQRGTQAAGECECCGEPAPQDGAGARDAWRCVAFAVGPFLATVIQSSMVDSAASQQLPSQVASGAHDHRSNHQQRQQEAAALMSALDLVALMAQDPQLAATLCKAGALLPLLMLLPDPTVGATGPAAAAAARVPAVVAALVRNGGAAAVEQLREEGALAALLRSLRDARLPPQAKEAALLALARVAFVPGGCGASGSEAARAAAASVAALRRRGAVLAVRRLLVEEAAPHGELARRALHLLDLLAGSAADTGLTCNDAPKRPASEVGATPTHARAG
jgi:hypothetical protein